MTSLLLIDLQRGMCDPDGPAGAGGLADAIEQQGVLAHAAELLRVARDCGWDVTHVHLAFDPGFLNRTNRTERFGGHESAGRFVLGSRESEFRDEVAPQEGERVVHKGSVSPFASTGLLESYLARGIDTLVIAGVATQLAVESAAREAGDRGIDVVVAEDACAAPRQEIHDHAMQVAIPAFARVRTTAAILETAR
jgi:nicotinamidase-related amidase